MNKNIFFIINLLQDISILCPLIKLTSYHVRFNISLMITPLFRKRDKLNVWQDQITAISLSGRKNIKIYDYIDNYEAITILQKYDSGVLIAGSESCLPAHQPVHDLFRIAPSQYTTITLQHGYECVGFMQSHDQDIAHGQNITFAADLICGWSNLEHLKSITASQVHKLISTGPSIVLQTPEVKQEKTKLGIVCENMHSPRLNILGDFKSEFLTSFEGFCKLLKKNDQKITLRPHPGGQYTLKNKVFIPENVILENKPIYEVDLSKYTYGISAPSSILIDLILAKVPVAVWQDKNKVMDLGNYKGLEVIRSVEDWTNFTEKATVNPDFFLKKQEQFIKSKGLLIDRKKVYQNFLDILSFGEVKVKLKKSYMIDDSKNRDYDQKSLAINKHRVLYIANACIPTLQLSFLKPLFSLTSSNVISEAFITEEQINKEVWKNKRFSSAQEWIKRTIDDFQPTLVVFCRYSGPYSSWLIKTLRRNSKIAFIYHIDDDLLDIPKDIGYAKYKFHNRPERLQSVSFLLKNSSLIYCSTKKLESHLISKKLHTPIVSGKIYCGGEIINQVKFKNNEIIKIGYMASADHVHNLTMVLDSLILVLRKNLNVEFELFGSITVPDKLLEFGDRIKKAPKVDNYEEFLKEFSKKKWDIGICPLAPIHFNLMKANTKWVEYTSVGAAVVASRGTVYDECCSDDCGILASTPKEWTNALQDLINQPDKRFKQVKRAQNKLNKEYSVNNLKEQVLNIFQKAHDLHKHKPLIT